MNQVLLDLVKQLIPVLGQRAVSQLTEELVDLSLKSSGWKKVVLALLADATKKYGPRGIQMATEAIKDITLGKAPNINWADLKVASDLLAELQNAEAGDKAEIHDFLTKVSHILGVLLSGLVTGL